MRDKVKKTSKYILYALYTNLIFGLIYYFAFTWLVKYSLLYAYLGSVALIIIGLILDKYVRKMILSEKIAIQIKDLKDEDREKSYRIIQWLMDSFVSFKTILFVFYFFILVVSQIINIAPTLVNESFGKFIHANSYGIVLIIAFDRIAAQFAKDRKRMKKASEELDKALYENED